MNVVMHAIGSMSFLLLLVISFVLLCVIAVAGDDFWNRHDWKLGIKSKSSSHPIQKIMEQTDLGRLFCVWLYRVWCALFFLTLLYFFGGKYVA
jgi:hypothetical protein